MADGARHTNAFRLYHKQAREPGELRQVELPLWPSAVAAVVPNA